MYKQKFEIIVDSSASNITTGMLKEKIQELYKVSRIKPIWTRIYESNGINFEQINHEKIVNKTLEKMEEKIMLDVYCAW